MQAKSSDVLNEAFGGAAGWDMETELRYMLTGEWGHWGILRSFDLTKKSKWWNPQTGEAINGPQWEYKDYLVRLRRVYEPIIDPHPSTHMGVEAYYPDSFFVASNVRPKSEDNIFEIAEAEWSKVPRVAHVLYQHQIKLPDYKRDGKLIYTRCYVVLKSAINDQSIHDPQTLDTSLASLLKWRYI
jgi:hypothetical protein